MRWRRRAGWGLLVGCVSTSALAADLLQVFLDARQHDSVFAAARDTWAATQERLPQARARLLPSATLSANPSYTDRNITFRDGTAANGRFNSNGYSLSVTQPLWRMQELAQYDGAKAQLIQADKALAAAEQDLILRTAQAYFDILLAQDNIDLAVAQKAAIAEQLAVARRNYQIGAAAITDAHDAQARYDLTVSAEIAARNELENRLDALRQVIGKQPPALGRVGPAFKLETPTPGTVEPWIERGIANSQQVGIQKAAVEVAEHELARNRYAHYPSLDAVASYSDLGVGQGTQGTQGNDTRTKVIGVQLTVPLYLGGAVSSQVRQARASLSRAQQELETARRQTATSVKQAFLGVTTGLAQIRALETALRSSESSLSSSRLGRDVGIRTQVDILNAQQQLFTARFNLAQARYNTILSWIRLHAAVGQLSEDVVREVNQWLSAPSGPAGTRTLPAHLASGALFDTSTGIPAQTEPLFRPVSALPAAATDPVAPDPETAEQATTDSARTAQPKANGTRAPKARTTSSVTPYQKTAKPASRTNGKKRASTGTSGKLVAVVLP